MSIVGSHGPVQVVVKPNIPKKLPALMKEYADMLVVLQTAQLSKERLYRLNLFLSDYCDESSFENCTSPEEIVEQLKVKLKIDIFNIDTLCACCEYFKSQIVNRSVQQYKKHLNNFLSTTSVKEFQSSLQTDEISCLDDTEPLTLKLKETANNDTLKNLKKLVYHFFGHSSKALIISVLEHVNVPEALVEELATLRLDFAKLLLKYEKELQNSPEAKQKLVEFLPWLFPNDVSWSDHSFQSAFNKFIEEEVSLFNIHYLKAICDIFPENIR